VRIKAEAEQAGKPRAQARGFFALFIFIYFPGQVIFLIAYPAKLKRDCNHDLFITNK
jgi:hypothetical protein